VLNADEVGVGWSVSVVVQLGGPPKGPLCKDDCESMCPTKSWGVKMWLLLLDNKSCHCTPKGQGQGRGIGKAIKCHPPCVGWLTL